MNPLSPIMASIHRFLHFMAEHQNGILATVVVHMVIVTCFLIIKIQTTQIPDKGVVIDFSEVTRVEAEQQVLTPEQEQRSEPTERLSNRAVNTDPSMSQRSASESTDQSAEKNIRDMVNSIKEELEIDDTPQTREYSAEGTIETPSKPKVSEANRESSQGPSPLTKGDTSVSYELANRWHIYMHIPVYKCPGSATVTLDIVVNRSGYITEVSRRKISSSYIDDCFWEAAEKAARVSRFNADEKAAEKQRGTITYRFVAQ